MSVTRVSADADDRTREADYSRERRLRVIAGRGDPFLVVTQ
jgi:hypothetical protein